MKIATPPLRKYDTLKAVCKRFVLIYLSIVIVLSIVLLFYVRQDGQRELQRIDLIEKNHIEIATSHVRLDFESIDADLRLVARLPTLHIYLDTGSPLFLDYVAQFLLVFSAEQGQYSNVRYVDNSGQEVVRINFNDGNPSIVPHDKLQNKRERYFFKDTLRLNLGEVYVSPMDLGVENNQLVIPYLPTIRFGTPVFDSAGRKKGVVLFDYLADKLLRNVHYALQGTNHDSMLLNRDGYWLLAPNRDDEWGLWLNKPDRNFGHDFPDEWRTISTATEGTLLTKKGFFVYHTIYPLILGEQSSTGSNLISGSSQSVVKADDYYWKIVSFTPAAVLSKAAFYNQIDNRILLVVVYSVLAIAAWIFSFVTLRRKQAELAMHQARLNAEISNRAKSDFLANMSHEIRTPMNAILGMTEILSETELTSEQRRYLGIFQNAGNTLLNLINDILDMSKVESGQLQLDKENFSLEQALYALLDLHATRCFDKGLELVLDVKPGVPDFVYGDAKRLEQCLTNLLGNAIKFSNKGVIVICVRPLDGKPDMLQFSVSDTGIGIPAEKHETIFDAFSQADTSTTRRFGGTGLGLTITRRLVDLMDGNIWVDSQEGKGSTFHFTAQLTRIAQPVGADIPVDLRNLKILVVDDFPINRTIVRQYLQPLGVKVFEAKSAKQALLVLEEAVAQGTPFDLALVDLQMPEESGFDLSAKIRANPELKTLTIMILSSDDTTKQRQRAKDLALPFQLKPIKRQALIHFISHALQQHTPTEPQAEIRPSNPLPSQEGLHILLAEDNSDNVLLIETFLRQTAHRLDLAEDGLVALEKFRMNRYDVILMDVQMPNLGGYEATEEIRRIEKAEGRISTTIFALTAHALKEDEQRSIAAGCSGHLTKPIKKKVLLEALQSIQ